MEERFPSRLSTLLIMVPLLQPVAATAAPQTEQDTAPSIQAQQTPDGQPPPPAPSELPSALQGSEPPAPIPDATAEAEQAANAPPAEKTFKNLFSNFDRNTDRYSLVSVTRGFSTHKPMFILPATWSPDYDGKDTELIFQISAKQQLFGSHWYFGYTQESFWSVYNTKDSRPFRETDYNPEIFYRYTPQSDWTWGWNADFGAEHQSNGEDVPKSRSWNRLYVAPYRMIGKTVVYLKAWYRIPEDAKKSPDDPNGDDNPGMHRYYGYGELHFARDLGHDEQLDMMVRGNPDTGKGALSLLWTKPSANGYLFWTVYLWQGYGESLLDYNHSVTRIGIGVSLAR